jgi:nicotinate-nucleotide pyrophosphorylase (carboxylating)
MLDRIYIDNTIMTALKEDMALGDITTDNIVDHDSVSKACFITKEEGVIAGLDVSERVFKLLDESIAVKKLVKDGDKVSKGDIIAEFEGNTRALLKGERTALNFIQRLSGIATMADKLSRKIEGLDARVTDTRKTTPGLRFLEKYAVRVGGGSNHRFSLSDGVLIKDNHIKAAGGIKKACELVRKNIPHTIKIEVETETMEQVREALDAGADIIMLDNMDTETMKEAVKLINKRALVEASGNVNLDTIYDIAKTGVDIISVGALTHSVKSLDISMKFK